MLPRMHHRRARRSRAPLAPASCRRAAVHTRSASLFRSFRACARALVVDDAPISLSAARRAPREHHAGRSGGGGGPRIDSAGALGRPGDAIRVQCTFVADRTRQLAARLLFVCWSVRGRPWMWPGAARLYEMHVRHSFRRFGRTRTHSGRLPGWFPSRFDRPRFNHGFSAQSQHLTSHRLRLGARSWEHRTAGERRGSGTTRTRTVVLVVLTSHDGLTCHESRH